MMDIVVTSTKSLRIEPIPVPESRVSQGSNQGLKLLVKVQGVQSRSEACLSCGAPARATATGL